jgi:tRNA A58 N-methylase Trm61
MIDDFSTSDVGQLTGAERALMWCIMLAEEPVSVFEAGTWLGGGSTYVVAQALYRLGRGMLTTVEIDADRGATANARYAAHRPHLLPYIEFHNARTEDYLASIPGRMFDAFVCDGGDRFADVLAMEQMLRPGGSMFFHDWTSDAHARSREYLTASDAWDPRVVSDSLMWVRRCKSS